MTRNPIDREEHLDAAELSAYLDNDLSPTDRARVGAHLAACDQCRREAAAVVHLLAPETTSRRRWQLVVPLAAAAAAFVILLNNPFRSSQSDTRDSLRVGGTEAPFGADRRRLDVISPRSGAVPIKDVRFAWHAVAPGALYRIAVSDTLGDIIWQSETRDTVIVPPKPSPFEAGQTYFWRVDALFADGTSATTSVMQYRTVP
jgi:hypothetical protein